jgi:hypothetical protein
MLRSVDVQFRTLGMWPGKSTEERKPARFRTAWSRTCRELDFELDKLDVRKLIIEIALPAEKIRRDGMPYADARPDHPGVILSFDAPGVGPLRYPCDTFSDWQDNIRAIAKTLEAQRMIDRYGVTTRKEQYTGFAQLPPPTRTDSEANGFGSHRDAAEFVAKHGIAEFEAYQTEWRNHAVDRIIGDADYRREAYRDAAAKLHPDRSGDDAAFKKLQAAKRMLEEK